MNRAFAADLAFVICVGFMLAVVITYVVEAICEVVQMVREYSRVSGQLKVKP